MAKVNKIYSSFYNGISQQIPELMHETNCKDMLNCIPDLVLGTTKRPPANYVTKDDTLPVDSKIVHTYDRGEDDEEYIFVGTGDVDDPLKIFDKAGEVKTLDYGDSPTTIKDYLTPDAITNLKGLTVQDRTFVLNKEKDVEVTTTQLPIGDTTSYYTKVVVNSVILESSSYPFPKIVGYIRVAFTFEGTTYYANSDSWNLSEDDPFNVDVVSTALSLLLSTALANLPSTATMDNYGIYSSVPLTSTPNVTYTFVGDDGSIYSQSIDIGNEVQIDTSSSNEAFYWIKRSSADSNNEYRYAVYLDNTLFETTDDESAVAITELETLINADTNYTAEAIGSVIKIDRVDRADFAFNTWDSWGDQASFGWKGSVGKLSDLPQELGWEDKVVEVTGDDKNDFTNYFIKSTQNAWIETKDPSDLRGALINMPIAIDRQADGTFLCSIIDWEAPLVGDDVTNPTPSFVGNSLTDIFFYKNRLGVASEENITLSKTASYYQFYIKTVLNILDTDPIDIAIASTKSSKIQYVKPWNGSLLIFSKDSQFEMLSAGATTPTTVSIEAVSSYPMNIDVEPVVSGNSMFFISTTNNKQQLREYRKDNDTLNVAGIDLNISTPTLINNTVQKILVNGVLGFVFVTTNTNEVYLYNYKENSKERVQSAWSRWLFYEGNNDITEDSFEYEILDDVLIVVYKTDTSYHYNTVDLTKDESLLSTGVPLYPSLELLPSEDGYPSGTSFIDTTDTDTFAYTSLLELPDWYPQLTEGIATPKDKILLKKITIEGEGSFDASVYRKDYATTYTKTHDYTTIQDLDIHVGSKVGKMDIYISDNTDSDFRIKSLIFEGLYSPTSKQIR